MALEGDRLLLAKGMEGYTINHDLEQQANNKYYILSIAYLF
jgi:hypothetical protein